MAASVSTPGFGRRRAAGICLIAAPIISAVSAALWPTGANGTTGQELTAAAGSAGAWTASWMLESLSWALLIPGIVAVLGYLQNRGRILGMIASILAIAGAVSTFIGGGLNAYTLDLAQQADRGRMVRLADGLGTQPELPLLVALIYVGLIGAVLLTFAAWRGALVRWWVPLLVVVGVIAESALNTNQYGVTAGLIYLPLVAGEVLLGVALLRNRGVSGTRARAKAGKSIKSTPSSTADVLAAQQ